MELLLAIFFFIIIILPIGLMAGNLASGLMYWAANEKRRYEEETD
jgi:nitrogen fixation-related uncharacterized protein